MSSPIIHQDYAFKDGLFFIFPDLATSPKIQESTETKPVSSSPSLTSTFHEIYFRAHSHEELYSLGESYIQDLNKNQKIFAFYSFEKSSDETPSLLLGVASHMVLHKNIKPLIITCRKNTHIYKDLLSKPDQSESLVINSTQTLMVDNLSGCYLLDCEQLIQKKSQEQIKQALELLNKEYGVLLVELSDISVMRVLEGAYFNLIQTFDSISLQCSHGKSSVVDIQKTIDFFSNYSIPIKGFVTQRSRK